MADVTIKYKGSTIAEMSGDGTKTLNTKGTYCEDNITVTYEAADYAPIESNHKSYEITLSKKSGWVELVTLDSEVLEHINDSTFVASIYKISDYAYQSNSSFHCIAGNVPVGKQSSYSVYGTAARCSGETTTITGQVYYPANNTGTSTSTGGCGAFRVAGGKYYWNNISYYVGAGTYRLTFTW